MVGCGCDRRMKAAEDTVRGKDSLSQVASHRSVAGKLVSRFVANINPPALTRGMAVENRPVTI